MIVLGLMTTSVHYFIDNPGSSTSTKVGFHAGPGGDKSPLDLLLK